MKINKIIKKKRTHYFLLFLPLGFMVLEEVSNTRATNLENAIYSFTNLRVEVELLRGVNNMRVLGWAQAVV